MSSAQRQRLCISGIVQGVGFRPFVYRLAQQLALSGWVRNDGNGVTLEIQGCTATLTKFRHRLYAQAPPLAQIEQIKTQIVPLADHGKLEFAIQPSTNSGAQVAIGPDSGVCPACLAELFDPANRRYRYPFINCTDCGPRYTLVNQLPYDRVHTSMAGFTQCAPCHSEYSDPAQRRFHAEPNACPSCGPQLALLDANGRSVDGDPIAQTVAALRRGEIVAIKGLGGFHLACDARNGAAVARLRQRKQREEKPLAIMAANCASLSGLVANESLFTLMRPQRPIVLMRKTEHTDNALTNVAPGMAWLGVMLPYTPLHYLLFHQAAGRPPGTNWLDEAQPLLLVMTSANLHGEPLVIDNADAQKQLHQVADFFLLHDRAIVSRCDDSVVRQQTDGSTQFLRRARGYAPGAIRLAQRGPALLALGAHYNNTLCLMRHNQAYLSPHIGDLDRVANCLALEANVEHLRRLLQIRPEAIAHDCHPDFFSTRLAQQLGERWQIPTIAVQHHHAHIGSLLAEHRIDQPVLGLALDGVGLGTDGAAWGGELLLVDGAHCQRLGHLRPIGLPGGEQAARAPWRMAAAALGLMGRTDEIAQRFGAQTGAAQVAQMVLQGARLPLTSSMGRWFDAAAGMLGVATQMSYEGQAAMLLEGLAEQYGKYEVERPYHVLTQDQGWQLDLTPLLAALADIGEPARGAALFHQALIHALAEWVQLAAEANGIKLVACGGGCFMNAVLARGLRTELHARGLQMLQARAVPPGDGGLSLGQAWVARRQLLAAPAIVTTATSTLIKENLCV